MRGLETRLGRGSWGTLARPGSCPDENSVRLGDQYVALVVGSIFRKRNCPGKRRGQTDLPCQYLEFRTATAGSYSRVEPSATGPAASGPRLFENLREHRASLQRNTCAALGRVDPRGDAGPYCREPGGAARRAVTLGAIRRTGRGGAAPPSDSPSFAFLTACQSYGLRGSILCCLI